MKSIILFVVLILPTIAYPFSGNGSGTDEDPYQITDIYQLQEVNDEPWSHYILMNDIDASETMNWNDGKGFEPIGEISQGFTGTFNGNGFVIRDLFIYRPDRSHVGLFGLIGSMGSDKILISEVGLVNCNITGSVFTGGFCGVNSWAIIEQCYSTGIVSAESWVGGFSGLNSYVIVNCYTHCSVSGYNVVGGFGGSTYPGGGYTNCYSTGKVKGQVDYYGFRGDGEGYSSNCFWDTEASESEIGIGATGLSTMEMMSQSIFESAGWDFDSVWCMVDGRTYPKLQVFVDCDNLLSESDFNKADMDIDIKLSPNPFSEYSVISYQLSVPAQVKIDIYNSLGTKITTLIDDYQEAGEHQKTFDAGRLPSGMYYYTISINGHVETGKMALVR